MASIWNRTRDLYTRIRNGEAKKVFREQILEVHDSNKKIAIAIGFGIFMSIFPIWGFQTAVAIFLAAFFRLNKVLVVILTSISIPPVIPVYLYLSFITGGYILNQSSTVSFSKHFNFENIQNDLFQYYLGAIIFSIATGLLIGIISYLVLLLFRKEVNSIQ